MKQATKAWLIAITIIVLAIRLFIALSADSLEYEAYTTLRQVQSIKETGIPLYQDELSYTGKARVFSPLFYYVLAGFSFVMPAEIALKVIPNIFASTMIIIAFLLAMLITQRESVALITAGFAGTIPAFFASTINNASIYTVIIPLFFLTTYYFLKTNREPKYAGKLIVSIVFLAVIHPASLILGLSFLVYVALIKAQRFRESSREPEVMLFFLFLVFWVNTVLYKRALSAHGIAALWQNMPERLITDSYAQITFAESIYGIGVIPLLFGLSAIYQSVFYNKKKTITMMMSICVSIFLLLWFRMIELNTGLIFLGTSLAILSAYFTNYLFGYAESMKIRNAKFYLAAIIWVVLAALFIPTVIIGFAQAGNTPGEEDVRAFEWLKNNTASDAIVLTLPEEGSAMSYFSVRRNVMDDDYLLVSHVDRRLADVTSIYRERFITSAIQKLDYYSVDYIVVSEYNYGLVGVTATIFQEEDCFRMVYPEEEPEERGVGPEIYSVECTIITR